MNPKLFGILCHWSTKLNLSFPFTIFNQRKNKQAFALHWELDICLICAFCVKHIFFSADLTFKIFLLFINFIIAIAAKHHFLWNLWFHLMTLITFDIIVVDSVVDSIYCYFDLMDSLLNLFCAYNLEVFCVNIRFPLLLLDVDDLI